MKLRSIALLSALALAAGCQHYYQVHDPSTGRTYYTEVVRDRIGGAVTFRDMDTGQDVTLQNSEVARIDRDVYRAHRDRRVVIDADDDLYLRTRPAATHVRPGDKQIEFRRTGPGYNAEDVKIDVDDDADVRIRVD